MHKLSFVRHVNMSPNINNLGPHSYRVDKNDFLVYKI